MIEKLLTVAEVSALLAVPKSWVYQKICNGELEFPFLKVGHFVRFRASDIAEYLERQLSVGQKQTEARRRRPNVWGYGTRKTFTFCTGTFGVFKS